MAFKAKQAQAGGFAVGDDIDHDDLAEQLGVSVMHVQEMYAVFKVR